MNHRWGRKLKTSLELKTYTLGNNGIPHILLYAMMSIFPFFGGRFTMLKSHIWLECAPVAHDSMSHGPLSISVRRGDDMVNFAELFAGRLDCPIETLSSLVLSYESNLGENNL
jgi:hypothetical protein